MTVCVNAASGARLMFHLKVLVFLLVWSLSQCRAFVDRRKTAIQTDQRVRLMNEILTGIRVIKMYCWENLFGEFVRKVRKWVSLHTSFDRLSRHEISLEIGKCWLKAIVRQAFWASEDRKNSSIELAVIWGNSVFALISVTLIHSTFTTWELIWYTPKWNKFDQMELLHIVSQQYSCTTKIITQYPLLNFYTCRPKGSSMCYAMVIGFSVVGPPPPLGPPSPHLNFLSWGIPPLGNLLGGPDLK